MSEKMQHTAASLREKMLDRYGDDVQHKHNKNHHAYRLHSPTHPTPNHVNREDELGFNESTGLVREFKLRKMRKRLDNGRVH